MGQATNPTVTDCTKRSKSSSGLLACPPTPLLGPATNSDSPTFFAAVLIQATEYHSAIMFWHHHVVYHESIGETSILTRENIWFMCVFLHALLANTSSQVHLWSQYNTTTQKRLWTDSVIRTRFLLPLLLWRGHTQDPPGRWLKCLFFKLYQHRKKIA